jgi:hypothetical protein
MSLQSTRSLAPERPERTRSVTRGARSLLRALGASVLDEFPLPNGRRADLVALTRDGAFRVVEVKSCLADFRADAKWTEYRPFCDRFYFAVPLDLHEAPEDVLPAEAGLILADAHGAVVRREAPIRPLAPATRRTLLTRFGQMAADRLHAALHPRDA